MTAAQAFVGWYQGAHWNNVVKGRQAIHRIWTASIRASKHL